MNKDNFQNSLFDMIEEKPASYISSKIDVVQADFVASTPMTWVDLFSGYNKIRAITFSSGINFVYQLLDMFEKAEIIFGCEDVISNSIQDILAYQTKLMDKIRKADGTKKENILQRVDEGTVRLFVSRNKLSHEKIYLLESDDGKKRVITGSANMSYNAFGGIQRENIVYMDGDRAYEWYSEIFENLKETSTDNIARSAIEIADCDENIDELPIVKTVKTKKMLVIEPVTNNSDDVEFILDVKKLSDKIKPIAPKEEKKTKKIILFPDTFTKMRRNIVDDNQREKELRAEYPELVIDVFNNTISLNGKRLDLNPSRNEIKADVDLFINYMEGYGKFHGDYEGMQYRYFEFANWFFCSPFMGTMRDMATRFNQNKLPYPVFGLVYGKSKAGKTSFLETLLKMMIGQKPKIAAPEFTRKTIEDLKYTVKGAPIIVDDLTNQRFNMHAIETIKNDDFGVNGHNMNYPAVVISANEDVKAVAPEIIRRTVICRVSAGLTNTEVIKSNVVRTTQQKIGTAFYREYLRRMMEMMPDLIEQIGREDAESAPDILACSSKALCDILNEYSENVPKYIRSLSLEDYFSEQVTGKYAIQTIQNAWKVNRKAFVINKKNNELRYNAGQTYEADRIIKELPETLEAHKSREIVIMSLEEAKEFFQIDFKKNIFGL